MLSTTAKVRARVDRKKKDGGDAEMSADLSVNKQESDVKKNGAEESKMDVDEEKKKDTDEEKKEEEKEAPEPTEAMLKNPSRVVKQ